MIGGRAHDFTLSGEVAMRRLRGTVTEGPIVVSNAVGQTVRTVEFGPSSRIGAADRPLGLALRDVWHVNERTDVDAGVRLDHSRHGGAAPSGRLGVRYALDESGRTVLKAGFGSFVGSLPLGAAAFGGYPTRVDRRFDPISGRMIDETIMQPTVGGLRLPRAVAVTIGIERQLLPRLDAQVALTRRDSTRLATLHVPSESGPLIVNSSGYGDYQEAQFSVRRTWDRDQQVFASYVRSAAHGDVNDFAVLFQALDAPLVQPGGMARLASDARDRVVVWGTFNVPGRVVVSPVTEWRSGFPYSVLSDRYLYLGVPNTASFPSFYSTDLVVYKTFTVGRRLSESRRPAVQPGQPRESTRCVPGGERSSLRSVRQQRRAHSSRVHVVGLVALPRRAGPAGVTGPSRNRSDSPQSARPAAGATPRTPRRPSRSGRHQDPGSPPGRRSAEAPNGNRGARW